MSHLQPSDKVEVRGHLIFQIRFFVNVTTRSLILSVLVLCTCNVLIYSYVLTFNVFLILQVHPFCTVLITPPNKLRCILIKHTQQVKISVPWGGVTSNRNH
jgi:hypothetical protein